MYIPDETDRARQRRESGMRAAALGVVAVAAAAGFGVLARAVARRDTAQVDEALHQATAPPRDHPARRAARAAGPVGKWWTYIPSALAASAYLLRAPGGPDATDRRSRLPGAAAVLLTGTVATALNPAFDHIPQPPAPPGHPSRAKPVFPSGHAFGPGAVSLVTAYVLAREGLARPVVALPAALALPLATAGGRVLEEKHWASDVLGGYLAAIALAAACAAAYEGLGGADRG